MNDFIKKKFLQNFQISFSNLKWPFLGRFWPRKSRVHGSLAKALL